MKMISKEVKVCYKNCINGRTIRTEGTPIIVMMKQKSQKKSNYEATQAM